MADAIIKPINRLRTDNKNKALKYNTPILVIGGTGFVGSYLLRYLIKTGYTNVRAIKRAGSNMDLVSEVAEAVQWMDGDVLDPYSLQDAMTGVEQVYHCAAVVSYLPQDRKRVLAVNVEGTANVVNEALACGVRKLIFAGSTAAVGRPKEGFKADENTKWEYSKQMSNYALSKHLAELEVWRGAAEGLNVAVVNPAVILGAGRWNDGPLKIFPLVWRNFPICPPGRNGFVDVRDVARFMIRLMESDISGERFILSSENLDFQHLMGLIAGALTRRPPSHKAAAWILQAARYLDAMRSLLSGRTREITREAVYHSSLQIEYDNRKSMEALNWSYIPVADTVAEAGKLFVDAAREGFATKVFAL